MRTINRIAVAATFVFSVLVGRASVGAQAPDDAAEQAPRPARVQPTVHKGDGWAMAAPSDWGVFRQAPRSTVLHLIGDGRADVPRLDGTLSAIQAGLTVERFAAGKHTLDEFVANDIKQLDDATRFQVTRKPEFEDVTLDDGTEARLMRVEFVRVERRRMSVHRKLYCFDPQGRGVVATGFLVCGRGGAPFVEAMGLPAFLEAHLKSLVFDADKLNADKLKPLYGKLGPEYAKAVAATSAGNAFLEATKYVEAAEAFRAAIAQSDLVSAAHNGLAWALLHAEDPPKAADVEAAVTAARRAVELTAEADYSALDTLALALHRGGERDKAIEAVRKDLEIQPNHPELLARLKSIEGDGR